MFSSIYICSPCVQTGRLHRPGLREIRNLRPLLGCELAHHQPLAVDRPLLILHRNSPIRDHGGRARELHPHPILIHVPRPNAYCSPAGAASLPSACSALGRRRHVLSDRSLPESHCGSLSLLSHRGKRGLEDHGEFTICDMISELLRNKFTD